MNTENSNVWMIYTDGSSCNITRRTGIGIAVYQPDATEPATTISENVEFRTSHVAEYVAVIRGLQAVRKCGAQTVSNRSELSLTKNRSFHSQNRSDIVKLNSDRLLSDLLRLENNGRAIARRSKGERDTFEATPRPSHAEDGVILVGNG